MCSQMSATKAVSGVPRSTKTAGTPNPTRCEALGTRPRFPEASVSCATNQTCRFWLVSAISTNSAFRVGDLAQFADCCIQPDNGANFVLQEQFAEQISCEK